MHRRPPAAPRPAEPHRVTIVTTCWGRDGDERYLVTRLVAGALLARAEVSILHLTPVPGPFPVLRDGAFEVRQVLANSPSPMRQALMLAAIDPSRDLTTLPDEAAREIFALEGGQTAEEIGGLLAATKPDAVVVAGLQQAWLASALRGLRPEPRVTVLPMTGRDARLRLAGYRDFLEVADSVGVLTTGERRSVIESAPDLASGSIFDLPLRFPVNREAL
ncbi:MAG TPA: hypothetical protein VGS21_02775, partial [Acidimicrobiales bacterium]|nr:hypothetical protein [Acidimicrobiales bacterium]